MSANPHDSSMPEKLICFLRSTHGLMVGELSAEAAITNAASGPAVTIKGRDAETGLPTEVVLASARIFELLNE